MLPVPFVIYADFEAITEKIDTCQPSDEKSYTYILLTKREGRTGRISARGLDSTDRAQRGATKKTESRYSPSTVPSKLG